MLIVAGYRKAGDDLGYHIEITGVRVAEAKSISVQTVKRIGDYEGAACQRPVPKTKK
jgi:hypothetical protein